MKKLFGGRKMNEKEIISEMIDMFFLKDWRKRMKYMFIQSKRKREDIWFRYNHGKFIDESNIKHRVNAYGKDYIYNILMSEGGNKTCFLICCGESGIYNTWEGLVRLMPNGLGGMLYLGNGVGYFQGEQSIGSPERYVLVNHKKKGDPKLFE